MKLGEIAEALGCRLIGDSNLDITGVADLEEAVCSHLTFLSNPRYACLTRTTKTAVLLAGVPPRGWTWHFYLREPLSGFRPRPSPVPQTSLSPDRPRRIGRNAVLGPHGVIERDATLGDDFRAYNGEGRGMARVPVRPKMLRWACERAGYDVAHLATRIPQLPAWVQRKRQPTLKQLEELARATHTPLGYLFLSEPPDERLPVPDYRTVAGAAPGKPSPNLLDTLYTMRRRQEWLRESLVENDAEPLEFVGSSRLVDEPDAVGREMRRALGLHDGWAAEVRTWRDALRELRRTIEHLGVMAVINGVVGNNTHRKLNVKEFRGFALADRYAPLIFVNGADAKSAQMFTLAHELAHIWLGTEGLSGFQALFPGGSDVEDWCNAAAAELLVPAEEFNARWREVGREASRFETLARAFKVSPIVASRRALDLGLVDRSTFLEFYERQVGGEGGTSTGGDFYSNQNTRVGELFATQVLRAAMEGRIGFKEAYDLTGLAGGTFQRYARRLGMDLP